MSSSQPFEILAHGQTDVGRRRQLNEDAFACDPDHSLFLVADGMGGHAAGEIASEQAVAVIQEFIEGYHSQGGEITWPFGIEEGLTPLENLLVNGIKMANRSVCSMAQENPEYSGMGTTVVGCHIDDSIAVFGHVGDSRAYLLSGDDFFQITEDHSWVNEQVQQNLLSEEEARTHRWRNIITRALGSRYDVEVDKRTLPVEAGQTILLCTDGLTGPVSDAEVAMILRESGSDVERACRELIETANEHGGPDNVTVLVIHLLPS